MRLRLTISFALALFALREVATAAPIDPCTLPQGLDSTVTAKFPGAHVLNLADLDDYDKKIFKKDHGIQCPGLVRVNFYGDQKPTWALVLMSGETRKSKAELLVARKLDTNWDIRSLETTDGTPVVWREGPGKYDGVWGDKTVARGILSSYFAAMNPGSLFTLGMAKRLRKFRCPTREQFLGRNTR
jgi:hypothetical protein